ncbi:MAG: hypothetical protein KGJ23_15575 [Euryarchaeota archaeon]|nr:hypothetical protein [Euryarchaeota archaeon]MDE1838019.1 hypothetical protein [Euryarchaeota archaeon]MDE1881777.1 hypothetical protein [Euryarchaeota archaeon]MDE2046463.1 hypothetical protein [Thermoplasmata archaeon]
MRKGVLAIGATCLVLGALVAFAPIFPVPSGSQQVGNGIVAFFQVHSLVLPQYLQVPWHASSPTRIYVMDCGTTQPSAGSADFCPANHTVAAAQGTGGTLSFAIANGHWVTIGTSGSWANISVRTTNGQVGFVVLVLGAMATLAAFLLRPEGSSASSATPKVSPTGKAPVSAKKSGDREKTKPTPKEDPTSEPEDHEPGDEGAEAKAEGTS